jgi:2-phosphosulfolactate phosphatase
MPTLDVLLTPAEFEVLPERDLTDTVCVVFDVLRATSSMITALANGASEIIPVSDIPEALSLRASRPDLLLAGERGGVRIEGSLSGGIAFDLGNSPREFARSKVGGRALAMSTTNGTRALRACAGARLVVVSCFLNLSATAKFLDQQKPANLLLVCSGTFDQPALEDILCAGALCDLLWSAYEGGTISDGTTVAHRLFLLEQNNLLAALERSRNGARLMSRPELRDDVSFCAQQNKFPLVATLTKEGAVVERRS